VVGPDESRAPRPDPFDEGKDDTWPGNTPTRLQKGRISKERGVDSEEQMKKLLTILGAIGIVASSSTAVASCGAKPANNGDDDIVDPTIKSALTSTGDLSKMLIVSKTENIGNNVGDLLTGKNNSLFQLKLDNFAQYSPTMLSRIKSANSYLSDDPIRKTEASDFAM
jgi:hypothetical protein